MHSSVPASARRQHRLATLLALAWAISGLACAAPPAVAPADIAAQAAAPTPASAARASGATTTHYQGLFAGTCQPLDQGLFFVDSIELRPTSASVASAQYRKALFSEANCPAASRLITLNLPLATWTLDGQVKTAAGKTVDLVTVQGSAGPITGDIGQPGKVQEASDRFVIAGGSAGVLPIAKAMEASNDKALRLIDQNRLYQGNDAPLSANGYPAALDLDTVYTRQ